MKKARRILLWGILGLTVLCLSAMGISALSNLTLPRNTTTRDPLAELDKQRLANQEGEVRFYYTGMAIARLLDRFSPGWQSGALQEGIWLEDLLGKAVGSGL